MIAALNLALNPNLVISNYGPITNLLLKLIALPFLPYILIGLEYSTELQLKFCHEKEAEQKVKRYKDIKAQTSAFLRTELGLEAVPQLIFSLLILLVSSSITKTVHGLEIFNDLAKNDNIELFDTIKIDISPIFLIITANVWTLVSSWRSYIRGLSGTKSHFPMTSQAILGLYVLMAAGIKVSSNILFLMPTLGIGNCLRHLQGERFPYWSAMGPYPDFGFNHTIDITRDMVYFSNLSFPWADLTRFDYNNKSNPTPPDVTLYTQFELKTYLISFWLIFVIQTFLIIIAKKISNPKTFAKLAWNVVITNCLENVWIQAPLQDWDEEHSSIPEYKKKQKRNMLEMAFVIFINMSISILMLVPIWILRKFQYFFFIAKVLSYLLCRRQCQ